MAEINGFGNCADELLGSAIDQCTINSYGDLIGIGLLRPGTKITLANLGLNTAWTGLVKDGVYFPYNNVYNFEQTTPENEIATSSRGLNRVIRDGKPSFTLTYDGVPCLVKSLQNKKGKVWDIVFFFEKGILGKENTDGSFGGFTASYFDVGTMRFQAGTDIQSVAVMFQIDNSNEFNTRFGFVTNESLGFDLSALNGAFESNLEVTATAGTSILVEVKSSCNSNLMYEGLELASNWLVNGVAPSAVTYSGGVYTLTVATMTAGQSRTVVLKGEDANDNVYRGSKTVIVGS